MAYTDTGGIDIVWASKPDAFTLSSKVRPRQLKLVASQGAGAAKSRADNCVIEGDNLHVMASLYKYQGKVDFIYTDPPYNTGNKDFRYNDRWLIDPNDTDPGEVVREEDANRHTKWLNFMTPRLIMMRRLLKRSGVIAISIDERELFRLGMLMDSIFGEENRLGIINWQKKYSPTNDSKHLSPTTEYVLAYAVNKTTARTYLLARTEDMDANYENPDNDPDGLWASSDLSGPDKEGHKGLDYGIQSPFTGEMHYPGGQICWRYPSSTIKKWLEIWGSKYTEVTDSNCYAKSLVLKGAKFIDGQLVTPAKVLADAKRLAEQKKAGVWPVLFFLKDGYGRPRTKRYLKDVRQGRVPMTFWSESEYLTPEEIGSQSWTHQESGHSDAAKKLLAQIVGEKHDFETVKPLMLVEKLVHLWCPPNGLVLDPFGGSGTTGHAVLSLNHKTGTNRRFILIEQGNTKENDPFARTLTAERLRRVIEGKWVKPTKGGKVKPLGGGFEFYTADGRIDRNAILAMARQDLVELICHADLDDGQENVGFLEQIHDDANQYLIARNRRGQAVCLVWGKASDVTEAIYEQARAEVLRAGLALPFRIYGKRQIFATNNMRFVQIPDAILHQLGLEE